eukprot:gene25323-30578_t
MADIPASTNVKEDGPPNPTLDDSYLDQDMRDLLLQLQDALYLSAHGILSRLDAELSQSNLPIPTSETSTSDNDTKVTDDSTGSTTIGVDVNVERIGKIQKFFEDYAEEIAKLRVRYQEVMETLHYEDDPAEWTFGTSYFGITTHYKVDHSDNSLVLKLEGVLEDLPLFEQCAVIHEVDLFPTWLPFCREGKLIEKLGIAELIPYIYIYMPPLGRDFIMHAYGADCLESHSKLLILGKSVDTPPTTNHTPVAQHTPGKYSHHYKPPSLFHNQMFVKEFRTVTHVLSPTRARTTIIADINPNTMLPQALLNMVIKNLAGMVLYFFHKQVRKISSDIHCEHALRIRSNRAFYKDWVLRKLEHMCVQRGWQLPPIPILEAVEEGSGDKRSDRKHQGWLW